MRLKKTFIEVILTLLIISWTTLTYALLTDLKVSSWNTLTSTLWNNLVDHSVPSWAVMSFDLEACPTWWSEYTALRWKFVRWADTWAINDPDFASRTWWVWTRKIWSTQGDLFLSHNHWWWNHSHTENVYYVGQWWWISAWWVISWLNSTLLTGHSRIDINDSWNIISSNWWSETRPKNVYLLYCKKN